jgi:hypothetical protein
MNANVQIVPEYRDTQTVYAVYSDGILQQEFNYLSAAELYCLIDLDTNPTIQA